MRSGSDPKLARQKPTETGPRKQERKKETKKNVFSVSRRC